MYEWTLIQSQIICSWKTQGPFPTQPFTGIRHYCKERGHFARDNWKKKKSSNLHGNKLRNAYSTNMSDEKCNSRGHATTLKVGGGTSKLQQFLGIGYISCIPKIFSWKMWGSWPPLSPNMKNQPLYPGNSETRSEFGNYAKILQKLCQIDQKYAKFQIEADVIE